MMTNTTDINVTTGVVNGKRRRPRLSTKTAKMTTNGPVVTLKVIPELLADAQLRLKPGMSLIVVSPTEVMLVNTGTPFARKVRASVGIK